MSGKIRIGLCIFLVIFMLQFAGVSALSNTGSAPKASEQFTLGGYKITGEESAAYYDSENGILYISGDVTLSTDAETTDRIVVQADCTVTLDGVQVKPSGENGKAGPAMLIESPYNVKLVLADGSVNDLTGSRGKDINHVEGSFAGIEVEFEFEDEEEPANRKASLTISGNGKLNVTGGPNAAGIGGSNSADGSKGKGLYGDITIESGTINATAPGAGAGIGSSDNPGAGTSSGSYKKTGNNTWGTITINGGTINAVSTGSGAGIGGGNHVDSGRIVINGGTIIADGAAGIGCGIGSSKNSGNGGDKGPGYYFADIEINGGDITATSNDIGAAIGGGMYSDAVITITGGTIHAEGGSREGKTHHGGAGIGGGYLGHASVDISGEDTVIYAIGGDGAAGIGSGGSPNSSEDRGINGRGNTVTRLQYTEVQISGGDITTYGGEKGGAGIGLGAGGDKVSVSISGGTVRAYGAVSDIEKLSGGAGIGSGYRGPESDTKYFVPADVDISITGGDILAVGGYGAAGIGSGGGNKMADTIEIDAAKANFEAYADGTKFAIDTRIVTETGNGMTQTTSRKEGRSYTGDILQGTFVHQYDEPADEEGNILHQGTEGLASIIVQSDSDPEAEPKELTGMPVGRNDNLHPGYRSFATNVSGPGSYTVYTDAESIGRGGGRYFSICTMDGRFVEKTDGTIVDTKIEGEGVQYRVVTDDLADNFYLFPVKSVAIKKMILSDEDDSPDLSGISMTCYFSLWIDAEKQYMQRNGKQWIESVKIVDGVPRSMAFFADVPDQTYGIWEVDADGNDLNAGIVFGSYELKRIETEHNGSTDNDATIDPDQWSDQVTVRNFYSEAIVIRVKKTWNDNNDAAGQRPQSLTISLLADGEPTGDQLELNAATGWQGEFESLPKYRMVNRVPSLITYSIAEPDTGAYESVIKKETAEDGTIIFLLTNQYGEPTPVPTPSHNVPPELPRTGFSGKGGAEELSNPASVTYKPVFMELQIPALGLSSQIVSVEPVNGEYPVGALDTNVGLLSGSALPGEGAAVIAGHNTLNAEEAGPFVMIGALSPGDHFFVRDKDGSMMIFEVYENRKIDAFDHDMVTEIGSRFGSTVTLLTCEDERPEGGYASRRIVSARQIN